MSEFVVRAELLNFATGEDVQLMAYMEERHPNGMGLDRVKQAASELVQGMKHLKKTYENRNPVIDAAHVVVRNSHLDIGRFCIVFSEEHLVADAEAANNPRVGPRAIATVLLEISYGKFLSHAIPRPTFHANLRNLLGLKLGRTQAEHVLLSRFAYMVDPDFIAVEMVEDLETRQAARRAFYLEREQTDSPVQKTLDRDVMGAIWRLLR